MRNPGTHTIRRTALLGAATLTLTSASVWAQNTPGYNEKIPTATMTPDVVETSIGTLNFVDGVAR